MCYAKKVNKNCNNVWTDFPRWQRNSSNCIKLRNTGPNNASLYASEVANIGGFLSTDIFKNAVKLGTFPAILVTYTASALLHVSTATTACFCYESAWEGTQAGLRDPRSFIGGMMYVVLGLTVLSVYGCCTEYCNLTNLVNEMRNTAPFFLVIRSIGRRVIRTRLQWLRTREAWGE